MAALSYHMPSTACEHLDATIIKKISTLRNDSSGSEPDFTTYSCLSCNFTSGFPGLDKHFAKTKHEFALSPKTVYCGRCSDLVYDSALTVRTSRPVSAISSKPVINGIKRKIAETTDGEDDSYLTANTSQRPCGRAGVRGLFNLGETCYMNAVLQMMVHNPLLASYFLGMGHSIHTCPISREPDGKKEKGNESDEDDDATGGDGASDEKKEQQSCVACGMTEVFSDVTMVDQPIPAHAVNLLFASWKNIPMSGKGQQDAQEWFMCIVDRLHEGVATYIPSTENLSHSTNTANGIPTIDKQCVCFFHKVFYGRYNSQITCDTCHTVSSREDEFSSISLDFKKQVKKRKKLAKEAAAKEAAAKEAAADGKEEGSDAAAPATAVPTSKKAKEAAAAAAAAAAQAKDLRITVPTLGDMLRAFTNPEPLSPEQYNCTNCNARRSAQKQTRIRKLPAILCVHVKRFGMKQLGTGNFVPEKYEGKMDFSLTLDMAPYTTRPPLRNGEAKTVNNVNSINSATTKGNNKNDVKKEQQSQNHQHQHQIDDPGRFVYDLDCVVVHQGEHAQNGHYFAFCRQDGKWFRFDDEIVSATTTEDVMRQEAYLLFYSLRKLEKA